MWNDAKARIYQFKIIKNAFRAFVKDRSPVNWGYLSGLLRMAACAKVITWEQEMEITNMALKNGMIKEIVRIGCDKIEKYMEL